MTETKTAQRDVLDVFRETKEACRGVDRVSRKEHTCARRICARPIDKGELYIETYEGIVQDQFHPNRLHIQCLIAWWHGEEAVPA